MTAMKLANSDTAAITAEPMAMPLVIGLGGVAHGVEVGQDLAGLLVVLLAHLLAVVAHLADAVGVVGHRAEHVHQIVLPVSVSMPMPHIATP